MGFLNEIQISVAHNYLNNLHVEHFFYGGYPNATRCFLCYSEEFDAVCNIKALQINLSLEDRLSHRDYLGSLMGLGISRECVGDIIVTEQGAVVFVKEDVADYIRFNLNKVGRYPAEVVDFQGRTEEFNQNTEEIEVLVSSMRIDNFVSSVCKCSRNTASEYISSDKVFLNYLCADKVSKPVCQGDTVSIRGIGKFKIGNVLRNTKSGRTVLSVLQYK